MSSTQIDNNKLYDDVQYNLAAPPPAQWNVPPGAPPYLSPNPQTWNGPNVQQWNPLAPPQWYNPATTVVPPMTQSATFHQIFLKGNPKGLGITLIVLGLFHIGMGIALFFTTFFAATYSGIPFWGALFNIIAGSLSVSATSKPNNICTITGSMGVSIVVSVIAVAGVVVNIVDFCVYYDCYGYDYYGCDNLIIGGHVLRGFFIATYLVQFSIAIRISVIGCRAHNHQSVTAPTQVFVLQTNPAVLQPSTVPGSYPFYPPQQPTQLPYMTQSGMSVGPTA